MDHRLALAAAFVAALAVPGQADASGLAQWHQAGERPGLDWGIAVAGGVAVGGPTDGVISVAAVAGEHGTRGGIIRLPLGWFAGVDGALLPRARRGELQLGGALCLYHLCVGGGGGFTGDGDGVAWVGGPRLSYHLDLPIGRGAYLMPELFAAGAFNSARPHQLRLGLRLTFFP